MKIREKFFKGGSMAVVLLALLVLFPVAASSGFTGGGGAPRYETVDTEFNNVTADATLEPATANLRLCGFTLEETATNATTASAVIRHGVVSGGNCTGDAIARLSLAGSESVGDSFPRCRTVPNGVCIDVTAGEVSGNIFLATEP